MNELPCGECGAPLVPALRPTLPVAFREWFLHGRRRRKDALRCSECGADGFALLPTPDRSWRAAWWGAPARVLHVVRASRTLRPVPATYAVAFAVGAAFGVLVDMSLGFPWWILAIVAPVATAVGFLLSGLNWPARRAMLRLDLADAVRAGPAPEDSDVKRTVLILELVDFPLYGLPSSWEGARYVGGHGESKEGVTGVTLCHSRARNGDRSSLRVTIDADYLATRLPEDGEEGGPPPIRMEIPVDGAIVPFEVVTEDGEWRASAEVGDVYLTIEAENFPADGLRLERILDPAPYVSDDD